MWGYAERRSATAVDLSGAQMAVLQAIYDELRASSAWPTMYRVDRVLIKSRKLNGARPATLLGALPEGLLMQSQSRPVPTSQDEIKLTISGVARCAGAEADVEAFWRAVRWCVKQEMTREPLPGETSIEVSWSQVKKAIPAVLRHDPGFKDRLFLLLTLHHWGEVQSARPSDGTDWTMRLGPDVRRFKNVRSIEDFIDTRVTWLDESAQAMPLHQLTVEAQPGTEPAGPTASSAGRSI
jgi:hypothetical protein